MKYVPRPTSWIQGYRQGKRLVPALVVIYAILLSGIVTSYRDQNYYSSLLFALIAGVFTFWGLLVYSATRLCWQRGSSTVHLSRLRGGELAATIGNRRLFVILESLAYAYLGVTLVSFPFVMAMIPSSGTRTDARLRLLALAMPVFGVVALCWASGWLIRRRGELSVGLSPEGLYHWSRFGCCFYAWEQIRNVLPVALAYPTLDLVVVDPKKRKSKPEENFLAAWPIFRRYSRRIGLQYLNVNPCVVYLAIVFYLRHPELRHELASSDGVRRIQKLEFAEVLDELEATGTLRVASERS